MAHDFSQANRRLRIATPLGPDALLITALGGTEGISTLFSFQAELLGHDEHADFDASYRYTCHAPLALHAFEVKLLERFPSLHKVNVDLVLPDRQGSQSLTPGTTTVLLSK